jgi:hypothetical protein
LAVLRHPALLYPFLPMPLPYVLQKPVGFHRLVGAAAGEQRQTLQDAFAWRQPMDRLQPQALPLELAQQGAV